MESCLKLTKENPRKTANVFSKLFFGWLVKLFIKGSKRDLTINDLYEPMSSDESKQLGDRLENNWNEEVARAKAKNVQPSLTTAIKNTFFWRFMLYGLVVLFRYSVLRASQPIVLSLLIGLFSNTGEDAVENSDLMYIYGAILVLQSLFGLFLDHHINLEISRIGMRVRIACCSLVYRKLLKLNKKSIGQTATGQVVNLLSNDVNRFDMLAMVAHHIWITPLQASLIVYLIYREVEVSAFAGLVAMFILTVPLNVSMGKLIASLRMKIAKKTDYRVRLMNEIISGIQVIKMYAWEKPFQAIVKKARITEIDDMTKASYIRGIFLSCMVFTERTALAATVLCYVLLDNVITADKVFAMAQFFNILQLSMAILFPMALATGAETYVTLKRLEVFLALEEKPKSSIEAAREEKVAIQMDAVTASWTEGTITLENLNLRIQKGSFWAVVGPVGAGKSSLLQLILGELTPDEAAPKSSGIQINGDISYAAQEPWLFSSTVRNNILFGRPYDPALYRRVVKVCALETDFKQFPQGDKTLVGERGVSLSGGQRARINLARTVYRQSDIYLLDDPLSAVDAHVGKHLFEECILKHLGDKTRVLVTHQLQFLKKADFIVVVNEGKIEAQGTFEELSNSKLDFTKLLIAADETDDAEKKPVRELNRRESNVSNKSAQDKEQADQEDEKAPDEEFRYKKGERSIYIEYFRAGGNWCVLLCLVLVLILGQGASSGTDYWLSFWTQQEAIRHANDPKPISEHWVQTRNDTADDETVISTEGAMYVYSGFILGSITITLLRSILFFIVCMAASRNIHHKMFEALLKAPMRFFDTNPSGRVLNRFSKDMGAIDEVLPRVIMEAAQILLVMAGILVTISVVNYYMIAAIVVLGVIFMKMRSMYLSTAKDIKRLEGIARSPVFSHINASLNGLATIRASNAQDILKAEFDAHQDVHTSAWYLNLAIMGAFGLWLDFLCVIFVACVTFSFIIMNISGTVSGSAVGLAISQSLVLTGMLQYGLRQTAEVVSQMTSVERVMQYTKLEVEKFFEIPAEMYNRTMHWEAPPVEGEKGTKKVEIVATKPSRDWPQKGHVIFEKLCLKYNTDDDEPILKDLDIDILPGQKIGIVGRTGAGKSSIIAALFRLAPIEGSIKIDDIDTQSIGLTELRKSISIIPQEPVLFSASLRYNLDPFDEYTDDELWSALEEVELKESVHSLNFMVEEGGSNFSVGQRQLVCLARAILRNNKILVLDEATANVDPRTDALIQNTIRKKFVNCTMLTIAHRLYTIMDSDRVLVMDAGRRVEYDHPHVLLRNKEGHFSKMVAETGANMSSQLHNTAMEAYQVSAFGRLDPLKEGDDLDL